MFENIKIEFRYTLNNKEHTISFVNDYSNEDFTALLKIDGAMNMEALTLSILPKAELRIEKLRIIMPYRFKVSNRIFANGYQSWTDSREFSTDEKMKTFSKLILPAVKKFKLKQYGDYNFKKYSGKKGVFHSYTYTYIRDDRRLDLLGSLTEKKGFTIIEHHVGENRIFIEKECSGLYINKEYTPFELFYAHGSEDEVFDGYFNRMKINKPRCKPGTGWTSWYNYYQNISQDIILENLSNFSTYNRNIDIFQIDDGYQTAVGDWLSVDTAKFPSGMKYIADCIKQDGYKAGIWLAPFVCETKSKLFNEKKDWLLRDENGNFVSGGVNWSGFFALDIYNPEVREYIKSTFSVVLNDWGYDMVKLDFLYAACLLPRKDKTRGQILTEAMEFLRECVGEKIILGCGVPLGPAFGLVDYCRIGCDVSLDWDDKFYMKLIHRERISTFNALSNTIGRHHLNGRAFLNDPDVFLLRDDNIILTETQKETLATVNSLLGSLLFTSDNLKYYTDKHFSIFDKVMKRSSRNIESIESKNNSLTEIVYSEDGSKFMMSVNLGSSAIKYFSNISGKNEELPPYTSKVSLLEK